MRLLSRKNSSVRKPNKLVILPAIVDLDEWCVQRGIEYVDAKPILLQARIWNITGALVSPEGDREEGNWSVMEDPWADRLQPMIRNKFSTTLQIFG